MAELPDWARAYRNFVVAFVVFYERAYAETRSSRPSSNSTTCSGSRDEPLFIEVP